MSFGRFRNEMGTETSTKVTISEASPCRPIE